MDNLAGEMVVHLFNNLKVKSLTNRIKMAQKFAAFYRKDKEEIDNYIRERLYGFFGKETIEGGVDKDGNTILPLPIRHKDKIHKVLRNKIAGIFDDEPLRELYLDDEKTDENLEPILRQCNYSKKIRDAAKKGLFFNVVLVQPVIRYGKLELDIFTPDMVHVETANDDYLKAEKIIITKWDKESESVYGVVWTEDEHYLIDANGKGLYKDEEGKPYVNRYKRLPFAILRIEDDGLDFWGEPNWNLLESQLAYDLKLTKMDYAEGMQSYGIWIGTNLDLTQEIRIAPNAILNQKAEASSPLLPDLKNVAPQTNFQSLRDMCDYEWDSTMSSEGMSAGTIQQDTKQQSGVSKAYDEIESQITRDELVGLFYDFEIELLNLIRLVWNTEMNPKLSEQGIFDVAYSEEKPSETVTDKKTRREMEKGYYYKTEIDFCMEDLEVDRAEAVMIIAKNLGLPAETNEEALLLELKNKSNPQTGFLSRINNRVQNV